MLSGLVAGIKGLSTVSKIAILVGIAAVILVGIKVVTSSIEEGGVNKERAETSTRALEEVGKANEARETIDSRTPAERDADCMRWARNPEDC